MSQSILLSKAYIDGVLAIARRNLEQVGYVYPMLFLYPFSVSDVETTMVPLNLPSHGKARAQYFARIGHRLLKIGCIPTEAIFLSEGWYFNTQTAPAGQRMVPHTLLIRQEAITIAGRNADHTRTCLVIHPFARDDKNCPLWQPGPRAVYDEPPSSGTQDVGLLDYLFEVTTKKA